MITLGALIDHLAPSVLSTVVPLGDAEQQRRVGAVVLYDDVGFDDLEPTDLVLGVGLRGFDDVTDALRCLARRPPQALLVRADLARHDGVRATAEDAGIVALGVDPAVSWMQLAMLLRHLVAGDDIDTGLHTDDLFQLANALAALVDAPVTIEDPHSRVLAFSEGQERADDARRATILGRKAPAEYYTRMKQHGVFRTLQAAESAIFVPGRAPDIMPRFVQPVRASGEFLGSIWLAVHEPLEREPQRALEAAAHAAALHLLRMRLDAASWRTSEAAAMSSLLAGGTTALDTARSLGLTASGYQVAVFATRAAPSLDSEAMLLRVWDRLRLSVKAAYGTAITGKVDDAIYAVLPLPRTADPGRPDKGVREFATGFLRNHAPGHDLVVGLGAGVPTAAELTRSAQQAVQTIAVLRRHDGGAVADIVDVGAEALLAKIDGVVGADPSLGADDLERLRRHDRERHTQHVTTVQAWLDAFGDTDLAARRLGVHPNTIRYRLRQIRELGLIDLDDPTRRIALMLHLRRSPPDAER